MLQRVVAICLSKNNSERCLEYKISERCPEHYQLIVSQRIVTNMFSLITSVIRFSIIIVCTTIIVSLTSSVYSEERKTQEIPQAVQVQLDSHSKQYVDNYEKENCEPERKCGTEYKEARRFCLEDIDGDGKDDIAVIYILESFCCGNNYHFHLAVFINKGTKYELVTSTEVGGNGSRGVNFNTIKNGKIQLNTVKYLPGDAMCCPSSKGRTTYILKNGKLIESDRGGEKNR